MAETPEGAKVIDRGNERACPCCGYHVHWHDGEENWASCSDCDLPVKHFGVYDKNAALQRRVEAAELDAKRYRFIRDGHDGDIMKKPAYRPEESSIWGGDELDRWCDKELAALAHSPAPEEEY